MSKKEEVLRSIPLYKAHQELYKTPKKLRLFLHKEGFIEPDSTLIKKVQEEGKYLLLDPVIRSAFQSGNIEMYVYEHFNFYKFIINEKVFWVQNTHKAPAYKLYVLLALCALLVGLFFIYRYIERSIKPLKRLYEEIIRYSKGAKDINTQSSKTDEVSMVANAFHESVQKIEALQNGRALLLKTIMHELNTPLTRGKILTPMLDVQGNDKQTLSNIFLQMQQHLKKLQEVDAITSDGLVLDRKRYALIDIVDEVSDLLSLENELKHNVKEQTLEVDFTLFCSALQNLIDNAIKYSTTGEASLCVRGEKIFIINEAAPLKENFLSYAQPFKRESKEGSGMGLGLFVSLELIKKHGYDLKYRYFQGKHFICIDTQL